MSRIIICGLNGSGKTTLGKALANRIHYIHKDIEMYYFTNKEEYQSPRNKEEVVKEIECDFQSNENIILTACKGNYGNLSQMLDLAILIQLEKETRMKRVKERSYQQFGDRILENGDLYEREQQFFEAISRKDESDVLDWFQALDCEKMILDGNNTVEENIKIVMEKMQNNIL